MPRSPKRARKPHSKQSRQGRAARHSVKGIYGRIAPGRQDRALSMSEAVALMFPLIR